MTFGILECRIGTKFKERKHLLVLRAHLFLENLGTGQLAKKLEGTQHVIANCLLLVHGITNCSRNLYKVIEFVRSYFLKFVLASDFVMPNGNKFEEW